MRNVNWEGPHQGEPGKRIYTRRLSGFDYDPKLNAAIAALRSFGVRLSDAQKNPYGLQRNLLAFSGLEPFQLIEDFVTVHVAQLPPSLQNSKKPYYGKIDSRKN